MLPIALITQLIFILSILISLVGLFGFFFNRKVGSIFFIIGIIFAIHSFLDAVGWSGLWYSVTAFLVTISLAISVYFMGVRYV